MPEPIQKRRRPSRHLLERILNAMLLDGRVAALSYRFGLHGRLAVVRHELTLGQGRRLPAPLTVAFASDFHAGPTTHDALFDALGEQIRHVRPDVLLYGGDYVSFDAGHVERLQGLLRAYAAPLGTYAVIGNHDIWNGRETHSPDGLWHLSGERFDLAFAGHTHAGQLAWANGKPVRGPSGPLSRRYNHGRYPIDGNGPLLVTSGIGCSGVPLRWNTSPELLVCTVR
jgi:predicted MPP superfamily phosphohydrolase